MNFPRFLFPSVSLLVAAHLAVAEEAPLPEKVDFNRDVRPILSDNCFKCHGFDPKTRDGGRRLDTREGALKEIDGVRAIVPGQLKDSDLHVRVHSADKDEQMPPPKTGKKLTARQKAILDRWIEQGAPYDVHWAFKRPLPPALPPVKNAAWPRNEIDRFVLARLEAEGLAPSPEADKYTLARRLSLDLIGLPPTPEEADAFVNDASPEAYEKLVDRLLASPHYGERWGRRWLDLARYADTNGYEKDRPRSIWPYRDWVINALNAGMPFDQFTIEQLAGDLLPNATLEQRIATGFHRNTMLNEEGGIDPLEFRYNAMTDRVGTTGTTWLGLTVGCAQCHTHKYDPITHQEYFQLMAFLNNADEPDLDLPPADASAKEKTRLDTLTKLLAGLPEKIESRFKEWLTQERERVIPWTPLRPVALKSDSPLLTVQPDASVLVSGDIQKTDVFDLKFAAVPPGVTAIRLEALPDPSLPNHGPGACYYEGPKGDFFLGEFSVSVAGESVKFVRASESFANNAFGKTPTKAESAIDGDPQTGWSCAYRFGEPHEAVFIPAAPLAGGELDLKMIFGRHFACPLGRFRISVTTDQREVTALAMPDEVRRLLAVSDDQLTPENVLRLREQFVLAAPELAGPAKQLRELRMPFGYPTTLVMRERPADNPRPTFIHHRGEYLQPTDRVEPGVIAALGTLPADAPRNRLGLARWLVSAENPLTARVTMNREWAAFFGRGLVRTIGDFGFQGEAPTHPELLDWLAVEFMRDGWSLKRMHKRIVMSATYRQASRSTPELLARDPENKLLARGARFRLEAEIVRDSGLRASGLLSEKMGGPSVRPPQPDGVLEAAYGGAKWTADTGENRYRRSIYTFAKRTAPFALYNNFDAPTGEACIARREVSNTPLQALALLNDVVFVEVARALGGTVLNAAQAPEERVRAMFRRCLTRPPTEIEVAMLTKFVAQQKQRFASGELDAKAFAGEGPGEASERAAWVALARALLNLDEAITRS